MPKSRIPRFLAQAEEKEKNYDWLGAVEFHKKALVHVLKQKDILKAGEVQERIGYCFFRAAFQAETNEDFKKCMQQAPEAYEKGVKLFEKVEKTETRAVINHCKAMVAYVNSCLATDLSVKREQLDDCWRLEKRALKVYEKAVDQMNVVKTCNNLMMFLADILSIEWNGESREKMIEDALEYGEKALKILSKIFSRDKRQLAQAYTSAGFLYRDAAYARGFDARRREECRRKALSYPQKAIEISEEIGDAYLIGLSHFCLADAHLDIMGSSGLPEMRHFEKALECGNSTKDNLLIAKTLCGLEFATACSAMTQEDPDKAREKYKQLDRYREDAVDHFNIVADDAGNAWACFIDLMPIDRRSELETNLKSKRLLIEENIRLGYKGLEYARLSGSMGVTFHTTESLGEALICLARVETDTGRKRALLEESSKYIEESISILKQASALSFVEPRELTLGNCFWFLALNQVELTKMEETPDEKVKVLKNAITNMRGADESYLEWSKSPWARHEKAGWFMKGMQATKFGKTLIQLYALTNDINVLSDAIEAFETSIVNYGKADSPFSRVAESYWQLAKAYDKMGDYIESARHFKLASENYILAAQKIPQLKRFYQDYASYMEAWSEIEKARHYHVENHYGQAIEHYEKASNLLKSTDRWNYGSPNYLAWARLEEAEDLSRREQTQEAKDLFQQAANLFLEAEESIQDQLKKIETKEEKELLVDLAKASGIRREYCIGRIALEGAKILDRQGNHVGSSRKYGYAAEKIQNAIDLMEDELGQRELKPIICLCRAWQKMTQAEAEASPDLYEEASRFFEEAKKHSSDEKGRLLALGHSRFCKALEAGARFEDTREMAMFSTAKRHAEVAENYYLKAGFKNASEYAKATQRLLDAYMYLSKAETETDPKKKTQYYQMAEKLLQSSVGLYMKTKHSEKTEQILRLLASVTEERELAISLTEVLHTPLETSTTATFTVPTRTEEMALGLERFENAHIQANIIVRDGDVNVGEDLALEIELVNAGKESATLVKIEEIVPRSGFKVKEKPEMYRLENCCLNMKGRRLNPLKTEDLNIVVKPLSKGTFRMKPRILYIDETGKYKSHEPEPVTITVKELGIKGWLKGER